MIHSPKLQNCDTCKFYQEVGTVEKCLKQIDMNSWFCLEYEYKEMAYTGYNPPPEKIVIPKKAPIAKPKNK